MVFISVEGHLLEPNSLLKPILVCRRPKLISFVLEALKIPGRHLVRLPIKLRLEFGGHPANSLPSRIDPFAQYHPDWGLDFADEWERGLLVHPLEDLGRER